MVIINCPRYLINTAQVLNCFLLNNSIGVATINLLIFLHEIRDEMFKPSCGHNIDICVKDVRD